MSSQRMRNLIFIANGRDRIRAQPAVLTTPHLAPTDTPSGDINTDESHDVQGGYRLQLLDNLQRPVLDLTPVTADSEFVSTDVTAQSYHIQLPPDFTCEDCTVRLMRQAKEWSDGYRFWSCADVDILAHWCSVWRPFDLTPRAATRFARPLSHSG
uniref:Uncharacterized protein n=1 Tax=Timema genevievae TaxID=629358 RepID=A0A7R9JVL4_TIMGE|nr:unnamed protein product [Timema genevievae]